MQTNKNKKIGLLILCLAALGFFFFFWRFNLENVSLNEATNLKLLQMIFTNAFLPAGLYFGLYFAHSKKLANQIGGGLVIFLIIAYILGFLLH